MNEYAKFIERYKEYLYDLRDLGITKINRSITRKWIIQEIERDYSPGLAALYIDHLHDDTFDNFILAVKAKAKEEENKVSSKLAQSE